MNDALLERMQRLEQRIVQACTRSGRARSSLTLVHVSKRHPARAIAAAHAHGAVHFGENYVQEWQHKAEQLQHLKGIRWHVIGHLQRNKIKPLLTTPVPIHPVLVHGVDNPRLIDALQRRAAAAGTSLELLLQVNLAAEASKSGCRPDDLPALVAQAQQASHLKLRGLMGIPPAVATPEQARPYFKMLRQLQQQLGPDRLPELSMGMSADFEIAIEEGATLLRIGTAVFGPRPAAAVQ